MYLHYYSVFVDHVCRDFLLHGNGEDEIGTFRQQSLVYTKSTFTVG